SGFFRPVLRISPALGREIQNMARFLVRLAACLSPSQTIRRIHMRSRLFALACVAAALFLVPASADASCCDQAQASHQMKAGAPCCDMPCCADHAMKLEPKDID